MAHDPSKSPSAAPPSGHTPCAAPAPSCCTACRRQSSRRTGAGWGGTQCRSGPGRSARHRNASFRWRSNARPKVIGHIDPVRVQLISLSGVVVAKPSCSMPSTIPIQAPPSSIRRYKPTTRMPRKIIMETKPNSPISLEHDRPGKQERDFQVEQDEQNRNQVIAHVEFHARVLEGLEAAFVGESFSLSGRCGRVSRR